MQEYQQHGHANANAASYDSSSVSSTASPQTQFSSNPAHYHSAPPTRPGSGLNPNVPMAGQSSSFGRYEGHPLSGEAQGPMDSQYLAGQGLLQPQISSVPMHNQKRAYRQRRKDPSCDACRERKVKCDATDTTSCSECSSRNVRCQFTKETNRRMSSIKQVQDLEKQLHQARQQLTHYRSLLPRADSAMDIDEPEPDLPRVGAQPRKRTKHPITQDLSQVRSNIRDYGRGVVSVPPPYRPQGSQHGLPRDLPELPPKDVADELLGRYYDCIHSVFPIIHWPTFYDEYVRVYRLGHVREMSREWTALLFDMLACGSLYTAKPEAVEDGKQYLSTGNSMIDIWRDDYSMDRARSAFLSSIFFLEINVRSASWVWIGIAVRIAQDIGLHVQTGPWSVIEGEMRKRLWYCLYTWDRVLALELGKPMLINEEDFDTEYPEPVDDQSISETGISESQQPSNSLLALIHVARSLQPLTKLFKGPFITPETLHSREQYLNACMSSFPRHLLLQSHEPLEPRLLPPILYYQNARLMLHRHNLSPSSPGELRMVAIEHCARVARDTAHVVSRCMMTVDSQPKDAWRLALAASASSTLCTHLWRSMLLLVFNGEYSPALVLARASAAIGDARPINVSCGRYISFFFSHMYEKLQSGSSRKFIHDEEMLAYVSGDLQASADGSWIWQGSETGERLSSLMRERHSSRPETTSPSQSPEISRAKPDEAAFGTKLSDEEASSWGGWERVERSLQYLLEHYPRQPSPPPQQYSQPQYHDRPTLPPLQSRGGVSPGQSTLSPEIPRLDTTDLLRPTLSHQQSSSKSVTPSSNSPSNSRMNIANII